MLFYVVLDVKNGNWDSIYKRVIYFSMLSNLDYPHLHVSPGVYWYFSLTFQYYLLYCFCQKYLKPINLFIISSLTLFLLYPLVIGDMPNVLSIYKHCFTGWFPLFAIGIWVANNNILIRWIENLSKYTTVILLVLFAVLIVLMNINVISWIVIPIISLLFFLLLAKTIINIRYIDRFFKYVGAYSAFIFVCHPIARDLTFKLHIYNYGIFLSLISYTLLTFTISYFYKKYFDKVCKKALLFFNMRI